MFNKIIEKYIKKLTKEDIINFSNNENIILNDNEIDIIYNTIKNDYKSLLYSNNKIIFNDLKNKINPNAYNKIIELYTFYKNKYMK